MAEEKKFSLTQIIGNVLQSAQKLVSDIFHLAGAEARLAKQSIVNIFLLCFVLGTFLTTTWLSILGLLAVLLYSYLQLNLLLTITVLIVVNLIVVAAIAFTILKLKRNLSFPATRNQLRGAKKLIKDSYSERITAKN
jgi:uncharacterized membrane protein YqjE